MREAFEREFYQFLENKGLLTILVKRYGKFLNVVSEELDRTAMPPDLIYLAIAESYLNPRAVSKANAGGLWQFIKDTGKREGLFINDHIDERYSVTRSTRSALGYLNRLHTEFGDWFLAMAAYNAGEARLREAIQNQNTKDFFEMFLPEETERYVYRVAALKEILANPRKYGLPIEKEDYYKPYAVAEVTIDLERETHTAVLAPGNGPALQDIPPVQPPYTEVQAPPGRLPSLRTRRKEGDVPETDKDEPGYQCREGDFLREKAYPAAPGFRVSGTGARGVSRSLIVNEHLFSHTALTQNFLDKIAVFNVYSHKGS